MEALDRLRSFLGRIVPYPRDHRPVVVRRTVLDCPEGEGKVEVDLLMGPAATPVAVLRCSCRLERPPACEHACRWDHKAVGSPARATLVLAPGTIIVPDEQD